MKKKDLEQMVRRLVEEVLQEENSVSLTFTRDQLQAIMTLLQQAHSTHVGRIGSVDLFELDRFIANAYDKSRTR